MSLNVSRVDYCEAPAIDRSMGLLGLADIWIDNVLVIRRVAIRQTRNGHLAVSFPVRVTASGERWPVVHPVDRDAHVALEAAILNVLRRSGRLAS